MLISVVIPFYNELPLIGRAVDSVYRQSAHGNGDCELEALIGNDGPHGTEAILSAIGEKRRGCVRILRNPGPSGPAGARNVCLRHASGELIAFLDADDYWLENKLAAQLRLAAAGATFIATGYSFENSPVTIIPPRAIEHHLDVLKVRGIGTSTVLVSRQVCESKYFRDLRFAQDIDYWYLLSRASRFQYAAAAEPHVVYSLSGSTRNKFTQLRFFHKVLRLNNISWRNQIPILWNYATAGVRNHYLHPALIHFSREQQCSKD